MRGIHFLALLLFFSSCSLLSKKNTSGKELVLVTTNYGNFKLKFNDETPLHKANFLALVDSGFYDSLLFHRVIKNFMVQGGDPDSKSAAAGKVLGNGGPGYQVDAEIVPKYFHKKGVLCAARQGDDGNPKRKSSGSQFYIVTGRVFTIDNLHKMEEGIDYSKKVKCLQALMQTEEYRETNKWLQYYQGARMSYQYDSLIHTFDPILDAYLDSVGHHKFNEEQIQAYTTVGGAPHLDGAYTVYGEVIEGMDVIDLISNLGCDQYDRPKSDVVILGMKRVKK
ncbi:MAG: peptidylprolyl isomerase [Crocinitomicaceae bacterium]|nr:peptidylprolyl isomerase [Crocinitomicaceae bacterium]|tara:strand:+ start:3477 stop:4316 length:840 start_codon:yes stop_codon:yes gene_type:complete